MGVTDVTEVTKVTEGRGRRHVTNDVSTSVEEPKSEGGDVSAKEV